MKAVTLMTLSVLCCAPASAQWFVAPFGGYSFGASDFDLTNTEEEQDSGNLSIEESSHFGFMTGTMVDDTGSVYLYYSHQDTDLRSGGAFTPQLRETLSVDYLHLGGTRYYPQAQFNPYISASIGLTQLRPGGDLSNETKFSMGLGTGLEYQISSRLSFFAEIRGFATFTDSEGGILCDGERCVWKIKSDMFWQGQTNLGLRLKF
ncbi:outer membrane beta-barrel protein [Ferrimonas kyonanensis]|uniref:outer membrane beta-barrel protein n=1 Tax=Ferrimonas kyonanensis TaxID=364763 RepID=UPI00042A8762|nr:outer membrane beta-barrel protein [Ferrimonas kyonanensis]